VLRTCKNITFLSKLDEVGIIILFYFFISQSCKCSKWRIKKTLYFAFRECMILIVIASLIIINTITHLEHTSCIQASSQYNWLKLYFFLFIHTHLWRMPAFYSCFSFRNEYQIISALLLKNCKPLSKLI